MQIFQYARDHKWLFLTLALFAAAQIARIAANPALTWDEAVYVSIGKYLFSVGQVGLYEPIRPLLVPLLAGSVWFVGLPVFATRVLMLLFSIAVVALFYFMVKNWQEKNTAVVASLMLAFTPLFFSQGILVLTETPALLLMLVAMWGFERKRFFTAGIACGLAFLTKFPSGMVFPVIAAFIFFEKKWKVWKAFTGFFSAVLPYFAFNIAFLGSAFSPLILASRHGANTAYAVSPWLLNLLYYLFEPIKDNYLLALALPGILLAKRKDRVFLITGVIFLAYFTLIANKQLRYAVFLLPALAYLASLIIIKLWTFRHLRFAVCCLLVFGGIVAVNRDIVHLRSWDQLPEPVISYIQQSSASIILTTDPVPAAYIDRKFIPFYFFAFDEKNASAVYEIENSQANMVLFTPAVFACDLYPESSCRDMLRNLQAAIARDRKLVFRTSVGWEEYFVYESTA